MEGGLSVVHSLCCLVQLDKSKVRKINLIFIILKIYKQNVTLCYKVEHHKVLLWRNWFFMQMTRGRLACLLRSSLALSPFIVSSEWGTWSSEGDRRRINNCAQEVSYLVRGLEANWGPALAQGSMWFEHWGTRVDRIRGRASGGGWRALCWRQPKLHLEAEE